MIQQKMISMTNLDKQTETEVDSQHLAMFLADYASLLLGCGATCIRIEKNTQRIAAACNHRLELVIMPTYVSVSVYQQILASGCSEVRKIAPCGTNFNLNAKLSRLSWMIADGEVTFSEALKLFGEIKGTQSTEKKEVLVLTSFANASFCRLFGGDITAMLIVFISTFAGYLLKQLMIDKKRDIRLTFFCSSFFSASLSAAGAIFNLGSTPEIAIATSVLYLIPGVPYINAVSDIIYKHYLCAFSRFMDAVILTACLSAGLCAGMLLLDINWY